MSKLQERALAELEQEYCISYVPQPMALPSDLIVEIGFGMGKATAAIAENNPDSQYIAIDVFLAGVGSLLSEIESRSLTNLRIIRYDAVEIFHTMIPDNTLSGIHIFFPDPWPKKKHHKRRLIQPDFVDLLCAKLADNGYIYVVTDWEDYAIHIQEVFSANSALRDIGAKTEKYPWRPLTRFENKAIKKSHVIREFLLEKHPLA
jgi:tRNA (guanine-N7-)-methyltransferase